MSIFDFGVSELPDYLRRVDKKLQDVAPQHIGGANRMLRASGKKLRPALVLMVAHYSGKRIDESVINAAAAVELVHLASLIHDDLMDGGTIRHGVPTIHVKEGADSAILAGDYLLAKSCALAARVSSEAAVVLAETIASLCEGQAKELSDQFNASRTAASLLEAARGKTASLFIASCTLGGLVSGLNKSDIKSLNKFAENFGIAFQYTDDIQDFIETPKTAGKSVGNDIREGNYTLPVILSLKGVNGLKLKELLEQKAPASRVLEILKADGSLDRASEEAGSYRQKALSALQELQNRELAEAFKSVAGNF